MTCRVVTSGVRIEHGHAERSTCQLDVVLQQPDRLADDRRPAAVADEMHVDNVIGPEGFHQPQFEFDASGQRRRGDTRHAGGRNIAEGSPTERDGAVVALHAQVRGGGVDPARVGEAGWAKEVETMRHDAEFTLAERGGIVGLARFGDRLERIGLSQDERPRRVDG